MVVLLGNRTEVYGPGTVGLCCCYPTVAFKNSLDTIRKRREVTVTVSGAFSSGDLTSFACQDSLVNCCYGQLLLRLTLDMERLPVVLDMRHMIRNCSLPSKHTKTTSER